VLAYLARDTEHMIFPPKDVAKTIDALLDRAASILGTLHTLTLQSLHYKKASAGKVCCIIDKGTDCKSPRT
jgi:hypothetical protein